MSVKIMRALERWALPFIVAAFVLGILLGLGLGWQVWPVRWYDTDPSDLRLVHQMAYVVTTADSLAITADPALAKTRLEQLLDEDTSWEQVANLVERVAQYQENAGDTAGALRVRQMARLTDLPTPTQQEYVAPEPGVTASVSGLGVLLLGGGLLLLVLSIGGYVFWRRNRQSVPAPLQPVRAAWRPPAYDEPEDTDAAYAEPVRGTRTFKPPLTVTRDSVTPTGAMPAEADDEWDEDEEEMDAPIDAGAPAKAAAERGMAPFQEEPALRGPFGLGKKRKSSEESPALRAGGAGALGVFEAEYSFGQDDFDCSFSIESPDGDFYGECGIGITDVLSTDGAQKVDAFELWLFDKGDIRTVSKILVSEYAHQDETLAAQLSAKGEMVPAEQGLVVELETLSLRVTATIKACQFADDGPRPNAYFALLGVDLVVDKGNAA